MESFHERRQVDRRAAEHLKAVTIGLFENHLVLTTRPLTPVFFGDCTVMLITLLILNLFFVAPQGGGFISIRLFAAALFF
jgi:hypothetical protein